MNQSRREFLATVAAGSLIIPDLSRVDNPLTGRGSTSYPLRMFSKPLDNYDFDFICDCVSGAGLEGIDLTVRPGGKIEPAEVGSLLPKYVERALKHNLKVDMIVTGILSASDPLTDKILKTASACGVKYYRLGWFEYGNRNTVWDTLQKYRAVLADITKLNQKYKIHGGYQNHSGTFVGAPVWDLHELFRDLPPEFTGSQYDVRHAMVEGADSWIVGLKLMSDHIRTMAIKDYTWKTVKTKPEAVTVPLGEGMVDWDLYFQTLRDLKIKGPMTLHVEYPFFEKGEEQLSLSRQMEIIVGKLKKDVDFIKGYLSKYQI